MPICSLAGANGPGRAVARGRAALLISHRFSTVRLADRIYVLDEGRVTEHGTHEELMAANRLYARLFKRQASYYDVTTGAPDEREALLPAFQGGRPSSSQDR